MLIELVAHGAFIAGGDEAASLKSVLPDFLQMYLLLREAIEESLIDDAVKAELLK